jgi:3-hydroxybutyryl-CoA dehydrogenase
MSSTIPDTIGVIGAGTMGAGIAQLAAQAGARTLLHDPLPEALGRGLEGIGAALERQVAKGRMESGVASAVRARLEPADELGALAPCGLVIEAAPERLDLKLDLFSRLAEVVAADCVLATNTSSLSVTEIAAGVPRPERVVGLHFFNPAPVMRLVEVVAGVQSAPAAVATARAVGEAMGKHVIDAADVAGFLVNRCNRPFSLESLRLLQERVATVEQIDRIARLGGGFRMGPFELMDLIGIETNHAVAEGFYRQTYGEPRYRPSPLAARMIAAGRLGRKTGRGWYVYEQGAEHRRPDAEPPTRGGGDGRLLVVAGDGAVAGELLTAATDAGFDARAAADAAGEEPWLLLDCGGEEPVAASVARAVLLDRGSLHHLDPHAVGFHVLPPFDRCGLVELTSTPQTPASAAARMETFVASLGRHAEHVGDAPGLVLGRIVCQLVNEAAFLIGEGNGTPQDVDAGMELGVNHPRGPIAWSEAIGLDHVLALLDALHTELGEERYRAAPLLRRRAALRAGLR